jgi:hypothetical protein
MNGRYKYLYGLQTDALADGMSSNEAMTGNSFVIPPGAEVGTQAKVSG